MHGFLFLLHVTDSWLRHNRGEKSGRLGSSQGGWENWRVKVKYTFHISSAPISLPSHSATPPSTPKLAMSKTFNSPDQEALDAAKTLVEIREHTRDEERRVVSNMPSVAATSNNGKASFLDCHRDMKMGLLSSSI